MAEKIIVSHGITFKMTGECNQCGACESKVEPCPHLHWIDGKAVCDTHGTGDYLAKRCDVFPDNPICYVVRSGICAYKFEPLTEEDARKYKILMDSVKRAEDEYVNRTRALH